MSRRRGRVAGALLLGLGSVLAAGAAQAAGAREMADGWLVPARHAVPLLAGHPDTAGGADPRIWLWLAQGRLYGLAELPQCAAAGGWRSGRLGLGGGWRRLGQALYLEDGWRLRLDLHGGPAVAGLCGGVDRLTVAGEPARTCPALTLVLGWALGTRCELRIRRPLLPPAPWLEDRAPCRLLQLAGRARGVAWSLVLEREADGSPSWQLAALQGLGRGVGLGLRTEPATGTFGLTTAWRIAGLVLRSSHLLHPELGPSHRWSLQLGWPEDLP